MAEAAEAPEEKKPEQPEGDPEEGKDEGEEVDLTKEPGGDQPADIYARRRARELKQTREERDRLRENNIRMEERLRTLEESKKETEKPKAREYSPEEVQDLIDKGEIKATVGAAYLARIEVRRALAEEEQRRQAETPLVRARAEIAEWVKDIPALGDQSTEEYAKANREFMELINRGLVSDDIARSVAIHNAFGDREEYRKKQAMKSIRSAPNTPSDSGGGGGGGSKPTSIDRAPAHLQEYWQKAGLNPKERETHFKSWQARQAKK